MEGVPECFYRISVKALVLNETRDKFLIAKEENGRWELLGGGLDWGVAPQEDLKREIKEETNLKTTWIAETPTYFLTDQRDTDGLMIANVLYETELENLDFIPSDECVELKFVNFEDCKNLNVFPNVLQFAKMFDPKKHSKTKI
ncbi:MAG: NUDIX domain-containing protein [Candidatus Paceibacterota bacterium]